MTTKNEIKTAVERVIGKPIESEKIELTLEQLTQIVDAMPSVSGYFPITSVSREDLNDAGFESDNVDDATMMRLASKMGDDYCEQLYWNSLDIIARFIGIPTKK